MPKKEKLELVHTDVRGPSPVTSLGGLRYYVTFIDNSTKKVWVYFSKNKSNVFFTFKRWKAEVENQTSLKLKCLKSDNEGEYDSQELKAFCSENGIRMIKTVPETPEQNGVAERMNRTLNERARSMRINSGLPKYFWAEAVNTTTYLINKGPSIPLYFEIPEEVWTGKEKDPKHRNVIFNENVMYKDKLEVEPTNTSRQTSEIIELEEISENKVARKTITGSEIEDVEPEAESRSESEPEIESDGEPDLESGLELNSGSVNPEPTLRRSKRVTNAPDMLTLSLHYLLLTDAGEREDFVEAMQLKKSLYDLKQAPRQWYKKFDGFMHNNGSSINEINRVKQQLAEEFKMKDLGPDED
ncbi:uncharacterized protein LOC142177049 [Nicotiana tabacum]|uniref:Uncharacterized protein LOC142177049 n=1 Tax=Nicotiana tabacum TaxID=4097 RepID=A0AC58TWK3_TOBAC